MQLGAFQSYTLQWSNGLSFRQLLEIPIIDDCYTVGVFYIEIKKLKGGNEIEAS